MSRMRRTNNDGAFLVIGRDALHAYCSCEGVKVVTYRQRNRSVTRYLNNTARKSLLYDNHYCIIENYTI